MYYCERCGGLFHHDDSPCSDGEQFGLGWNTLVCEDCTIELEAEQDEEYVS